MRLKYDGPYRMRNAFVHKDEITEIACGDRTVIIDREDFEKVADFRKWHITKRGDVCAIEWDHQKYKVHKLHRVVTSAPTGLEVDHINHSRLDNRKKNLRLCTHAQNGKNLSLKKNNKSGFPGVRWREDKKKWNTRIKHNYKGYHIGYYDSIEEAISARLFAEAFYFEEYAPNAVSI